MRGVKAGRSRRWITEQNGDPGKTRTSDTQFRKLLLYPPELRGHSVCGLGCNFDFTWICARQFQESSASEQRASAACNQDMGTGTTLMRATSERLLHAMAERVGFEPTVLVKVHTLSKRAP